MAPRTESFVDEVRDFALFGLKGLTQSYIPPPLERFDPEGSWTQSFAMYWLIPRGAIKVGEVTLVRSAKSSNGFVLGVQPRRFSVSGFSQFVRAELHCENNSLASPVSWVFDSKLARNEHDRPYLQSGRRSSGVIRDGVLIIRDKLRTSRTALSGAYGSEWALMEAVQRLPREHTPAMEYTLIKQFGTLEPAHTLTYRDQVTVPLKKGSLKLHSYCDVGRAVIPTTYWVDEHDRLAFVCTGLQVYALNATNGKAGYCPRRYISSHHPPPHYVGSSNRRPSHV